MLRGLVVALGVALALPGIAGAAFMAAFALGLAGADLGRDDRSFALAASGFGLIVGAAGALMIRDGLSAVRRRDPRA